MKRLEFIWVLFWFGLASCSADIAEIQHEIDAAPIPATVIEGSVEKQRLLQLTAHRPERQELVKDGFKILDAQGLETSRNWEAARKIWRELLADPEGLFLDYVFDRWVVNLATASGNDLNSRFVAYLANELARLNPGYFKRNRFDDSVRFGHRLESTWQKHQTEMGRAAGSGKEVFCPEKNAGIAGLAQFPELADAYALAIEQQCRREYRASFERLKTIWEQSRRRPLDFVTVKLLGDRLIIFAKSTSARTTMAWAYESYLERLRGFDLADKGFEITTELINTALWSARYDALLGNPERAKKRVDEAQAWIAQCYRNQPNLSKEQETALLDLRAEAAHILAYRIFTESGQFRKAYHASMQVVGMPGLSTEWRLRMLWFAGLYAYMDNDLNDAKDRWQELLAEDTRKTHEERAKFWLARVYYLLNNSKKANALFRELETDYPLSFYTVAAPSLAGFPVEMIPVLKLDERQGITLSGSDLSVLKSDSRLSKLRLRTELYLAAGLPSLAEFSAGDLVRGLGQKAKPSRDAAGDYLYAAKLLALSGRYDRAILQAHKIYRFVEEVDLRELTAVLFPVPYGASFHAVSRETGVPLSLLLSIARQESLFDTWAVSPAQAFGLMQLILPTAQQYGGLSIKAEDLFRPEINITLGGRYLNALRSEFHAGDDLIYGAYNAGEFAVKNWARFRRWPDLLVTMEMIPFSETRTYVQSVWRNRIVYKVLDDTPAPERVSQLMTSRVDSY